MDTFGPVQPHTDNGPFRIWVMGPYVQPETISSGVNPKMRLPNFYSLFFGFHENSFLFVGSKFIYIYIYRERERERERERWKLMFNEMETNLY